MRWTLAAAWVLAGITATASAQVTRTATFENFTPGQFFRPSFTDPLSGITFRDSTHPFSHDFAIDGNPGGFYFGAPGNYLTAGGGPVAALGSYFGFTADLPSPANCVSLDAVYQDDAITTMVLLGLDKTGAVVAQQSPPPGTTNPFTLTITSSQYDITTFRVSIRTGFSGYDNISYTVLPEPSLLGWAGVIALVCRRRRSKGREFN
jgi:hypothetical protein